MGTVGAVLGPSLIAPTAGVASGLGLPELSGAFVLSMALVGIAALASTLVPRLLPETESSGAVPAAPVPAARTAEGTLLRRPIVRTALVGMVAGQVTMVSVMTMTPVHLHQQGAELGTTGAVLSAHMLGMFALAPISGRLADRFGGIRVIVGGVGTLVVSTVLAGFAPHSSVTPTTPPSP